MINQFEGLKFFGKLIDEYETALLLSNFSMLAAMDD